MHENALKLVLHVLHCKTIIRKM